MKVGERPFMPDGRRQLKTVNLHKVESVSERRTHRAFSLLTVSYMLAINSISRS